MKYIPKYQKGSIAQPRIERAVIGNEPKKLTGDPSKYPDQTKEKRNIHTNAPVMTPYEQWLKQRNEKKNVSEVAEKMKTEQENTKKTSEVYTDPQTNKTVVQSIGIKPTASPIDFAIGGVGALYSGGTKLLGAFADLANPIPMPGIRTLAYKVDNYLPASIDKFIKPRVTLSGKELTGTFMNNKTRLAAGAENAVYRYGTDKVVKIRNFDNPTKDIAGIKQSNRLISELGGPNTRIAAYYRHPTQKTLQPILKQDFVEGVDPTAAEIKNFVLSKGMRPVGDISGDAYFYKNYTIADLHSKNLIKDKSGILRPIDLYSMKGIPKWYNTKLPSTFLD